MKLQHAALIALLLCLSTGAQARGHRHHSGYGLPWCGIWMEGHTGIHKPGLALARNWAREGSPASGPAPGVIGVMPHHVFQVLQVLGNGLVLAISGNDGNAVRTRPRSTSGVIAWRRI
jgi:hypothetical protein